jgi:dTDP-4-amino-4,6-dideoxygalactose transaminase
VPIPLFDVARDWAAERDEVLAKVDEIAATGAFTLGEELRAFEAEWAAYCGTAGAAGVSSGTAAIELILLALGAGPEREVVAPPHTFFATIEAIAATGARPVLADIDPATGCNDPRAAAAAVTAATAAVVAVHLYGHPAATGELTGLGVPVVEDAAQAHGAVAGDRRAGSLATAAAFSFYPTKNLGAFGDAGAVTSDDEALLDTVRSLRHHGSAAGDANRHELAGGGTERLDNLQAAVLRIRLRALDARNAARRAAAARYRELLAGLPLELPAEHPGHAHHLFVVQVDDRDRVLAALRADGIGAAVHYPTPAHLQPALRALGHGPGDFPHAERAAARSLSLPAFAGIGEAEQAEVAAALSRAL